MKNNFKRFLAMFLAVMMIVGACAFPISAAGSDKPLVLDPDCEHTWGNEPKEVIEPTCGKQGYELWYCSTCSGYEQRNVTAALKHDPETIEGSDATCKEDGVQGGVRCKNCKEWLETEEAGKKLVCGDACKDGHVMDEACSKIHEWVLKTEGTLPCTDPNAKFEYECSVCGATADAANTTSQHTYVFLWNDASFKAPTCEENGQVKRVCSTCGEEQACREAVIVLIKSYGHDAYVDSENCTNDACVSACTRCDWTKENKHGVAEWTVVTDSTCKAEGVKTGACLHCGNTIEGVVAKKTHSWDEGTVTTAPTCTAAGVKTFECANCDDTKTEAVDMLAHTLDEGKVTQEYVHTKESIQSEITTYSCTACSYTNPVETKKAEHDKSEISETQDATCQKVGYEVVVCSCGYGYVNTFDKIEHVADETKDPISVEAATCVEGGYAYYPCTMCGTEVNEGKGIAVWQEPTGTHTYEKDELLPTHLVNGHYYEFCSVCGIENEEVRNDGTGAYAAEGHQWYGYDAEDAEWTWSWTYGEGCEVDRYFYKWCTVAGCEFYCSVDPATYATEAEANSALQVEFNTNLKLLNSAEHYKYVAASGHEIPETGITTLVPAKCNAGEVKGYVCADCGAEIITGYGEEINPNKHNIPELVLTDFAWSCDKTTAQYYYSIYDCPDCADVNTIYMVTVIGAEGIKITTDESLVASGYTLVNSITISVNGKVTNPTTFEIAADTLTADVEGGTGAHVFTEDDAKCNEAGSKTCLICNYTVITPATENHEWEVVTFDCVNGGTKKCSVCGVEGTIDPIGTHTDPADEDKVIADPTICQSTWTGECAHKDCTATVTGTAVNEEGNHHHTIVNGNKTITVNHTTTLAYASMPSFITFKTTPTCANNEGSAEFECEYCATVFEIKVVVLLEHKFENNVIAENLVSAATCEEYAVYKVSCTDCGLVHETETFEDEESGYVDHKYVQEVADEYLVSGATCLDKAVYNESCEWCGEASEVTFESGEYADCKLTQNKKLNPVKPNLCTEYNFRVVEYCEVCDTVYTIAYFEGMYGHQKGELVEVPATCLAPAYSYYNCKYCGEKMEETVERGDDNGPHRNQHGDPLTGHCYFEAHNDYFCVTCENTFTPDKHLMGEPVVEKHTTTATCTVCGVVETKTQTCDEAESWVEDETQYVAPTTTTTGKKVYVCSICGETKEESVDKIPAVEFSVEVANPNGSDLVNGGKAYVTIKIKCNNINVQAISVKLDVDQTVFSFVNVVPGVNALGGNTTANADANGTIKVAAFAGTERQSVAMNGEYVLCVLEFDVVYQGGTSINSVENDVKESVITFVEDTDYNRVLDENGEKAVYDLTTNASVTAKINQIADVDNNGQITLEDVYAIKNAVDKALAGETVEYDSRYDINKDGKYTTADFALVVQAFIGKVDYATLVAAQPDNE